MNGKKVADYTLWTSASDLRNLRYYVRTCDNSRIRMIDLKKVDLDASDVKTISIGDDESIEDVSGAAR
ncbi:MAG TPA: linear amide C-N hydrolase [Isosphaeraceae bacterium]|nr:linear amide C-N hydrolase [Isosphaeraceae bacterium]